MSNINLHYEGVAMFKRNSFFKLSGIITLLFCSSVKAENWQAITDAEALTKLLSDTVIEATLKDGVKASEVLL